MTKSYQKSVLRKYRLDHPWAKKLPKSMKIPSRQDKDYQPIDLGVIDLYDEYGDAINDEEEARRVGDGAWAIVYDRNRKGEWLFEFASNGWVDHICSECRYTVNTDVHVYLDDEFNHCPRCGADMQREHGIRFTDDRIVLT